ncbi:NlpC/P60 family protein [Actinoallomurus purpureus]|uniref:C40 family peptidase n=1 Tax=Actinoallomurus purpureus TaxID=478114 RepID=UPI0020921C07|nr:NlpC/P60 family protein [Actinoallomurus purpureus]MCO6004258.1 NlpC/P60 family protein [Actinoallomurus purpureus]
MIRRRLGAVVFATLAIAGPPAGPVGAEPAALSPGAPGARFAEPGPPSASDVARGRERVREETARVGRIGAALAQADGLLDDLGDQAESAVERYNGERVRLAQAGAAYEAAVQRSAQARRRLAEVRDDVAALAAGAYQSQGGLLSGAAALGGPGGPAGFLARATTMQVLANRQHALLQREAAVRTVADVFERQARDALAARQEATRSAADAWHGAVTAVTRQQEAVKRIQGRKAALVAELDAARTHAAALEHARAAALERARLGAQRTVSSHHVVLTGTAGGRALVRGLTRGTDMGSVAASAALKWLGTPYSWGGGNETGPTRGIAQGAGTVGFDCSGLVTYAWARAGLRLVHYATAQYSAGPHPARSELRPGDLVFFAHDPADPSTIHHVGIYIGDGRMVEAPFTGARVRISPAFRPDYAGATRPVVA